MSFTVTVEVCFHLVSIVLYLYIRTIKLVHKIFGSVGFWTFPVYGTAGFLLALPIDASGINKSTKNEKDRGNNSPFAF